jgi:hypothetical protein
MSTTTVPFPESPKGDVHVDGGTIYADGIVIHDPELAEVVRQAPEGRQLELVERAIRIGLTAVGSDLASRLQDSTRLWQATIHDQVTQFGDRMTERVTEQLGEAGKDGHLQRRMNEILLQWSGRMKAEFEKSLPDLFDGQTKKSVERIDAEGDRVFKQIASLFSEGGLAFNELREVRREFNERLDQMKTAFTVAQTKAANPSPREAGLSYEAMVSDLIATIGSLRGDDVENTAKKVGKVPRCQKGDTRILPATPGVDVTATPCVAVEIRDREDDEFSLADVETMMRNREAQSAVIVAAHAGSFPKQYAGCPFAISWQKRLIMVVLDPGSPDAEVVLAAVYYLACVLAIEAVRQTTGADWEGVVRTSEAIEDVISGMTEDHALLGHIERKAHEGATKVSKRHAQLVRLMADLLAIARGQ